MHPELFSIGSFTVSSWSFCVIIGVLLLIIFYLRDIRHLGVSEATIDRIIIVGAIAGIFVYVGCSLFDTLWHAIDIANETGKFSFFDESGNLVGGVTFEGGIILGFIVWFILFPIGMKRDKHHSLYYMDQLVSYILLGHSIGRIGCFLAGCCYGKSTTSIFGLIYPTDNGLMRVYPTQLIEASFLLVFFFIFRFLIKRNQTEKYLIVYGLFRFFLEYLRGDNRGMVFGGIISPSQFMSIIFIIGGIICIICRRIVYHKKGNDYDKFKEKHPTLVANEAFLKQLDQVKNKYGHDQKLKFKNFFSKKEERKSKEELEKDFLVVDEVFDFNTSEITAPIVRYYQTLEKETKKDEIKNYFFIGEIIVLILLIFNTIYTTTEGIKENNILEENIKLVDEKVVIPDNYQIRYSINLYVRKSSDSTLDNHIYTKYVFYNQDEKVYTYKYYSTDNDSKDIKELTEEDYKHVDSLMTDDNSYILRRKNTSY